MEKAPFEYDFEEIFRETNPKIVERNDFYCDVTKSEKKYYSLAMFPYPSGNAHMGHVRVYTIADVKGRFKKLKGHNVLNPLGWDAFGLPAENAAIQNKVMPDLWTQKNIDRMRNDQFAKMGWAFDLSKEISSCDPDYYKWTQWIFLQFYKHGKAYRAKGLVNWCPVDQTVLANEQVIDGHCWRDGAVVEKKELEQWFLKISDYSNLLWEDISKLKHWANEAVAVQKNWINKSEGARIDFDDISVFTTRADTLFGVVALVVAPEHPFVAKLLTKGASKELSDYVTESRKKSVLDRVAQKSKTGVPTGVFVKHPLHDKKVEVWVGDYVLGDYGTGAVMCVPSHDARDGEFAKKYKLPFIEVVKSTKDTAKPDEVFEDDGILVNSGEFTGQTSSEARVNIAKKLEAAGFGARMTTFNLRDWSVGRQRYWGCPIPMLYCDSCGIVPVPEKDLPVLLPKNVTFKDGKAEVDRSQDISVPCPKCKGKARRELDTLDTFMCSSWYAYRFLDPQNPKEVFSSKIINEWMPIDFYVGGLEHAAQHMIYFRFFTKFFKDIGLINFDEPVDRFFCNGMVTKDGSKMSKSKGNIVTPSEVVEKYGSDALRLYILADTPSELDIDWADTGMAAKYAFVKKTFRLISEFCSDTPETQGTVDLNQFSQRDLLQTFFIAISQLETTIENNLFHNGVAKLYELTHALQKCIDLAKSSNKATDTAIVRHLAKQYAIVSSIFLPYFSEALYSRYFNKKGGVYNETWPSGFDSFLIRENLTLVIQVNGKKKATMTIPKDATEADVLKMMKEDADVQKQLGALSIKKHIYVKGRILNLVV